MGTGGYLHVNISAPSLVMDTKLLLFGTLPAFVRQGDDGWRGAARAAGLVCCACHLDHPTRNRMHWAESLAETLLLNRFSSLNRGHNRKTIPGRCRKQWVLQLQVLFQNSDLQVRALELLGNLGRHRSTPVGQINPRCFHQRLQRLG